MKTTEIDEKKKMVNVMPARTEQEKNWTRLMNNIAVLNVRWFDFFGESLSMPELITLLERDPLDYLRLKYFKIKNPRFYFFFKIRPKFLETTPSPDFFFLLDSLFKTRRLIVKIAEKENMDEVVDKLKGFQRNWFLYPGNFEISKQYINQITEL